MTRSMRGLIAVIALSWQAAPIAAQPLLEKLPDSPPNSLPSPGYRNPTEPLTDAGPPICLEAVEQAAWANNPTLRQAREQVEGTLGKALQAGLWPNPTVGYVAEQIGVEGTAGEFHGAFVEQEIVTARKRRISREKYLARARAAEFVALAQQYRVINDIRRQFWRALGAARLIQIHEQLLKNAQDRVVTNEEMFNVGQANTVDVRLARIALQQAQLNLRMTRNDYSQALRELAAIAGIPLSGGQPSGCLEEVLPPLTWDSAAGYILNESPELRETHAKLQADQITVERERVQPIPNVFVRGGVGYNFETDQTVATAAVVFSPPLWNRNQGTRLQALADLRRQQEEIRRVGLRLERDLARHFRDYLTASQHVEAYREEILPEAEKAYKERLEAYKERRQAWPEVLDAQRILYMRQEEYVRNLVVWRENRTLIEGFLLTGGLDAPPNPTPPGHIDATPQPR